MSRNYELMTQLAVEAETTNWNQATAHRSGAIPKAHAGTPHATGPADEQILRLVHSVFLSNNGNPLKQVVFCGVEDRNASSAVCAAAARSLALESSRPVCVVDGNPRSAPLSGLLGAEARASRAGGSAPLRAQCFQIEDNLWLAAPNILGDDNRKLLPQAGLRKRLAQLTEAFDFVLIDAPGTGVSGDAQLLGSLTDAAILVVEAERTRRLAARNAQESLVDAGVRLLGTVLSNRSFPIPEAIYKRL
jgi:Mrp family chromosome partitioning ATPase